MERMTQCLPYSLFLLCPDSHWVNEQSNRHKAIWLKKKLYISASKWPCRYNGPMNNGCSFVLRQMTAKFLYTATVTYIALRLKVVSKDRTLPLGPVMPHFAKSQFAENRCHLLIFLKRKFRWVQTKLTLTVTLTLTDTVTVIFSRALRWHP